MKDTGKRPHLLIAGSDALMMVKFHGSLIRALEAEGWRITIAVPPSADHQAVVESLISKNVRLEALAFRRNGLNPIADAKGIIGMIGLAKRVRPDVLLAYTVKPVIYGLVAGWIARVPRRVALITGLGYAFTGKAYGRRRIIQLIVSSLYRLALRHASIVAFQNVDDERQMRVSGLLMQKTPSIVIDGCGVDTDYYSVHQPPSGPPVFLMVARVIADKGVHEYVEAARIVRTRYPKVRFRLLGGVDSNPGAIGREHIQTWVSQGHIEWSGHADDVREALAASSIFVLPSYREGLPQSTIEALSSGRGIITTDVPGCRETVIQGVNGYLIKPHSAEALADACFKIIEAPQLIDRFGAAARDVAERRFSAKRINAIMLQVLSGNIAPDHRHVK